MTGFAQEQQDIETLFITAWAAETPIAVDNYGFDPAGQDEFVHLQILNGDAQQASLSSQDQLHRYTGLVQVGIYVPKNTGQRRARQLIDRAHDIFLAVRVNNITFYTPYPRPPLDAGNYQRHDLIVGFYRDDMRQQAV